MREILCRRFGFPANTKLKTISVAYAPPSHPLRTTRTARRLRPIHTNDTFYAWASPALIGLALYISAKSSGTRLYSAKLAWTTLVLLNIAAIAGTIALDLGYNNGGQEYREWLWWIRAILGAGLVTAAWNMIATVARREGKDIYLSNWYTIGGTLWTIVIMLVKPGEHDENHPKYLIMDDDR
ncbi:MAG: cbb3-type cytochrome c oxidase subunit I [Alcaligenaceae bacterium]|nr:cbb3-type cytochrome c oxidase subunit I [Alcaligenaceae bacterium]